MDPKIDPAGLILAEKFLPKLVPQSTFAATFSAAKTILAAKLILLASFDPPVKYQFTTI